MQLVDDKREIKSLQMEYDCGISDSKKPVTQIAAYREDNGALWFAVYVDDVIVTRINSRYVIAVNYEE